METRKKRRIVKMIVFVLPMFLVFLALLVWAVSALWNWLMPSIFGVSAITYWQALGLMALSWILFRGFRGPAMGRGPWRYEMRRRWERMTPEQREEFLKGLRSRCGPIEPAASEPR